MACLTASAAFCWTGAHPTRHDGFVALFLALLACWFVGATGWHQVITAIEIDATGLAVRFDDAAAPLDTMVAGRPTGITLDLAAPAIITRSDDPRASMPIVRLRLRTADDAGFARAAADGRLSFLPPFSYGRAAAPEAGYRVSADVPPPRRQLALPPVFGDDPTRPLVVIDPGHGGIDPGAISADGSLREKDVALRIAQAVRDALLASGRVRVAMTRDDDRFLVLQERYGIARKLKAQLFISVHCDSVGDSAGPRASGATAYTLSEVASDKESARLAARENKADIIAGVNLGATSPDISSILIDLTQRQTMRDSATFAALLGREAGSLIPVKPNFHRMASLVVLKAPDMPSILFETGYLSNPRDAAFISSADGRRAIAQTIRRAVEIHFARRLAPATG